MVRQVLVKCLLVLVLLFLPASGWASDKPSERKSAQLTVSVTVIHSTQSPQAPVAVSECSEGDGQAVCRTREEAAAAEPVCVASEGGTWCWY